MEIEYNRPWLYQKQKEAIFCSERYGLCEASTKAGKTVGCIVWLFEQALQCKPNQAVWWVAPVYTQAKIAYNRLKHAIPSESYKANDSDLQLKLVNGVIVSFKTAEKPDNLYGDDVYAAVIDEASRCREEAWHALRSTLSATRGPVRIIGNVKGRKNWFYYLCRKAEAGEPGTHFSKLTAWDAVEAGVLDREEIEDAKRSLPDHVYRELYLAEPSENGANPFGVQSIAACVQGMSKAKPEVFGIDLAKSVDWTVIIGLDSEGRVCYFDRFQKPWEETITQILDTVGNTSALVDSTGVGDPVVERLQRDGGRNFDGFKFTSSSKQQLMEGLAVSIQRQEIGFPDNAIRQELDDFEFEYSRTGVKYSAPEGLHDDCVMALALANQQRTSGDPAFFVL